MGTVLKKSCTVLTNQSKHTVYFNQSEQTCCFCFVLTNQKIVINLTYGRFPRFITRVAYLASSSDCSYRYRYLRFPAWFKSVYKPNGISRRRCNSDFQ